MKRLRTGGVTCHFVDPNFDTGDIIKTKKFPIDPYNHTLFTLTELCQIEVLKLFKEVINMILEKKEIPRSPQSDGRYISKKYFDKIRNINLDDSIETIDKKISSFWYPPYHGASIKIKGKEYSLLNSKVLKKIGDLIWKHE